MSRSRLPSAYTDIAVQTFLFAGLDAPDVSKLLETPGITVERYARGDRIRSTDEAPHALGILLCGSALVEKREGGNAMRMSILQKGDLFGAASMFCSREAYVAEIIADGGVWTLMIPEAALRDMMRREPRVMENYLCYLTARIRFLSERIDSFVCGGAEERILLFLSNNAENGVCKLPYGMETLAKTLSMSRATLYRALDALAAAGKLEKDGRNFIIKQGGKTE